MPSTGDSQDRLQNYEIGIKDLCIETCFLEQVTLLIFKKSRSCTDKLTHRMDWTEHGGAAGAGGGSTRKTSASTLKAGELKNSQTGMFYFKKVDDERNRNTGRTK